jgi:fimbrial chaperone protein
MVQTFSAIRFRWAVVAAFCAPCLSLAASLQVAPVRVVLTALHPIAAMTVGNSEDSEIAVQAEVFEWSQQNGKDVYKATQDVLVNPAIFRLAGGSDQIVRVGLRIPGDSVEHSYRIFLQQLPRDQSLPNEGVNGAKRASGASLQTLLRIGVPIFVPPLFATHEMQWRLTTNDFPPTPNSGRSYVLGMKNEGTEHVQLTRIVVRNEQGVEITQKSLSQYVLAGQSTSLPLDLPPLASNAQLQIEVQSDSSVALPAAVVRIPRDEKKAR